MRILSPPVKTALVFYTSLVLLIGLLYSFAKNPASQPSLTRKDHPGIPAQKHPIPNFCERDKIMYQHWARRVAGSGHPIVRLAQTVSSPMILPLKQHCVLQQFKPQSAWLLKTVKSPVKALPALIQWGTTWKGLADYSGLMVTGEHWGYSRGKYWVKLTAADVRQTWPFDFFGFFPQASYEITLIQPFRPSSGPSQTLTGWLPMRKPPIPFKPIPAESIPPGTVPPQKIGPDLGQLTPKTDRPKVAIIVDDIGYRKETAEELLEIPAPLTWAVLPFTPFGKYCQEAARKHRLEILLHLPLEPSGRRWNPGPGTIMRDWTTSQIRNQLDRDLQAVQGAVGINNHMGSAGTRDLRLMEILMGEFKHRKLFFVDSMTDARSVAGKYAGVYQVPFARRQVFIDNNPDLESQKKAFRKLIQLALQEGAAIGITHARSGNAQAIDVMLPEFKEAGVKIVPVSEILK